MNITIANAMYGYLETLYGLNQKLVKLCGSEIDAFGNNKEILDIIQDFPRIIPYGFNDKEGKYELRKKDGLLEFENEISYLLSDYEEILNDNYDILEKMKKIRNKCEHKMHAIKERSASTGTMCLFEYDFQIGDEIITVSAEEFIKLIKKLNELFSNIVGEISEYAEKNDKTEYVYYIRINRFDFKEFNSIYDNSLLRTIGKLMQKF